MITFLQTADGIRFGIVGGKPGQPAPTLFVFSNTLENSLENRQFSECGEILAGHGVLMAALDMPGHGGDVRAGESGNGLTTWRMRMEKGDPVIPPHAEKVSRVLDHLVAQGLTDPSNVSACGTSRGGFMALHWAAAEPRVQRVVAFAPVTDLLSLTEFNGAGYQPVVNSQALIHVADRLAGRPIWMCIGNHDVRVDTRDAIAFMQRVTAASIAQNRPADIELRIQPSIAHGILASSHADAAAWLLARMQGGKPKMQAG